MEYTGAPPLTNDEIESLLSEAIRARFCSLNKDGTIHVVPVAYMHTDDEILFITPEASQKVQNVKRNKNVTVLIDVDNPYRGVIVYGQAELVYDDVFSTNVMLLEKVMSKDLAECYTHEIFNTKTKLVVVRVKPRRMVSYDYSKDEMHKRVLRAVSLKLANYYFNNRLGRGRCKV